MVSILRGKKPIKIFLVFFLVLSWLFSGWLVLVKEVQAVDEPFVSSGTFTPSDGIYAVDAECWGGGGAGGGSSSTTNSGGGGGGGAYSRKIGTSVTPGTEYTVTVGVGGTCATGAAGSNGGDSWFSTTGTVLTKGGGGGGLGSSSGGAAGIGGTATLGVGDTRFSGGKGYNGIGTSNAKGGGGGGSAGTGSNGNNATSSTAASAVTNGGPGGTGGLVHKDGSVPASGPGGGGGGGGHISGTTNTAGGAGYVGQCIITYTDTWAPSTSQTSYSPTWSFATVPINNSTVQIGMTATTGYDYTGPIYYFFTLDNTGCGDSAGTGGDSSAWQDSVGFSDSGLEPNHCYGYKVTARDGIPNTGTVSSVTSTFTSANIPGIPALTSVSSTSLRLTNAENNNPSTNPTTLFAVQVVTTTPDDFTWITNWVNASGNPSGTAVWLTDTALDALDLQGLTTNTTYGVKVKAKNQDGEETDLSTEGQGKPITPISISITTDGSINFNYLGLGASADSFGLNHPETISVDTGTANLVVRSTAFIGVGNSWSLGAGSETDRVLWQFSKDGSSWSDFAVEGTEYPFDTGVTSPDTRNLYLRLYMPSDTNSYVPHSAEITIVASEP